MVNRVIDMDADRRLEINLSHREVLTNGCTITGDLYCQQLDRVAEKPKGRQDHIYYFHGNAQPHVAKSI